MFSSTGHLQETETNLPVFAQWPEAVAERQSVQWLYAQLLLNIEPSVLRCAVEAPTGFQDVAPPAVQELQEWSTEGPRSLSLAPPGARFLTTWPSTAASPVATCTRAGSDDPVLFMPVPSASPTHAGTDVLSGACHDVALVTSALECFGLQSIAEEVQPQVMTNWSPEETRVQQPSIGSTCQQGGKCRPCSYFTKDRGCSGGADCLFCHVCQPCEKWVSRQSSRKRRWERERFLFPATIDH
ncbi:unnamed protein product [Polarella glacialis]|uniref:C3H1-type domain-containing protein n=1 Tax=Polarella glacialis TaxID=89957 RepID=A0A813GRP0_POLGL|nr:unnamed protein product [Polarella glacialis]